MKMETNLPFEGFYNSIWDGAVDREEEQAVEWMRSSDHDVNYSSLDESTVHEVLSDHTNHAAIFKAIAEQYVDAWADYINDELGLGIQLEFSILVSPREYNFTTDRIFCEISRDDIAKVYRKVGRKRLSKKAEEMFTSRSGFISFYSPRIEEWGPVRHWDYNQLGCLMAALADMASGDGDGTLAIYEALQEKISYAYQTNVEWDEVEADLSHLLAVEAGEAEMDARLFPKGGLGVAEYVRQFEALNNLRRT